MFTWKKAIPPMEYRFFSSERRRCRASAAACLGFCALLMLIGGNGFAADADPPGKRFPLEMQGLLQSLTDARLPTQSGKFPRVVEYGFTEWNMLEDTLVKTVREIRIPQQPMRIIPHSVGLTEILWAIAPREHMAAVHRSCLDPDYSFLAKAIPKSMPVYASEDAEVVIGLRPDLILTTYYSSEEFKNRLRLSSVPFVELGFYGDIPSIEAQIESIGEIIGEEKAARHLVQTMEERIAAIRAFVRSRSGGKKLRVLYYGDQGFVAGRGSTFDSLCRLLEAENVAAAKGIRFFKQIDYETVLQWDPDLIIVAEGSGLERELLRQEILKTATAVRLHNIKSIPNVYLMASSQFAVASLNYLGGLFYGE